MNAEREQLNRTVQVQFVDHRKDLLFEDVTLFGLSSNTKLPGADWDVRRAPARIGVHQQQKCNMWWTRTNN